MKTIIQHFKLSEDADEAAVMAKIAATEAELETLRAKLAEVEATKRQAEVEATLSELIEKTSVLPAEKEGLLKLAETSPEAFSAICEARKGVKLIALGETGDGGSNDGDLSDDDPTVELAEKAKAYAKEHDVAESEAQIIVLSEDSALAARYNAREL